VVEEITKEGARAMRLEHCIGRWLELRGHFVRQVEETEEALVAEVEAIAGRLPRCGCCGRPVRRTKGRLPRREWRDLMIRHAPLVIAYAPRRVVCPDCGVRVERVPWAERWSRVTRSLFRAVAELARRADLSTVADHYAINWKTVASVIRRTVEWGLKQRRQRPLRVLGLDEVSRKKGHHYLTLAYDLERGELAWVGQDRTSDTVAAFFDELGWRRSAQIEAVCMDMWKPYRRVVEARAPQATICFDRFHVVRHLNAAVDEARRALMRKLAGPTKALIKGTRFVLLKNPWTLQPAQRQSLSELVRRNHPLSRAWYLKEDFQRFWDYLKERWAERHLRRWLAWASRSRLPSFQAFARLVREHLDGILAWTRLRISNGALEGMNNKVKLVSHRSYGFRNDDRYIEAIYHNCGNLTLPPEHDEVLQRCAFG
jgi:transposase